MRIEIKIENNSLVIRPKIIGGGTKRIDKLKTREISPDKVDDCGAGSSVHEGSDKVFRLLMRVIIIRGIPRPMVEIRVHENKGRDSTIIMLVQPIGKIFNSLKSSWRIVKVD
ncbi:uncharacterized protein PGTG_11365 [Puccinia graminis f. sp. tritici CRL 75-36-700-3]|uniref:Uncharacterized protein n=1 Tax=Puccinia graminis f. sp. tritici (strain CRL 75-36-700-3 / race SCCL) TaxID=418459 RepID=E3KLM1_PUCGT|nr:uncharacterized protein PGTG_11365 [Puccinia graminis f. sp. tritici CRL 75-36-700-3]EFP85196.1 hypothetical protein PGTG_11365 [Puccinia graminis f. sp. tritici CRL 75-36-700-3]